ncbi:MAG: phage holin family protein [Dongiaceae bacterium]
MTAAVKRGADEVKSSLRRAVQRAVLCLAALVLLACGAGFLVAAGFMALADEIGPIAASLWIGIAFAVVGVVLAVIAMRKRAPAPSTVAPPLPSLSKPLLDAGQEIGAAASRNPLTFVLAAFVAGLLLSRRGR